MKTSKDDLEMAAAASAGPDALKIFAEKQALVDERDRAVTNLASQTQAWHVEREQLKVQMQQLKSSFEAKLAEAQNTKITPGAGDEAALAATIEKLNAVLKASIQTGDLRGAAVAEIGKVAHHQPFAVLYSRLFLLFFTFLICAVSNRLLSYSARLRLSSMKILHSNTRLPSRAAAASCKV
jgi:hypothetical protein